MESVPKSSYSGQGARPKTSGNTSKDDASSDDGNCYLSNDKVQSSKAKVQIEDDIYLKAKCEVMPLDTEISDENNDQVQWENVEGHHQVKESGYGDWLSHDLEVNGKEVKDHGYRGQEVKGQVVDSGYDEMDCGSFCLGVMDSSSVKLESQSDSDKFLQGIKEGYQDKIFHNQEQYHLKKWQESGLKLWKILHERDIRSKQKRKAANCLGNSSEYTGVGNGLFPSELSGLGVQNSRMCRLEELALKQAMDSANNACEDGDCMVGLNDIKVGLELETGTGQRQCHNSMSCVGQGVCTKDKEDGVVQDSPRTETASTGFANQPNHRTTEFEYLADKVSWMNSSNLGCSPSTEDSINKEDISVMDGDEDLDFHSQDNGTRATLVSFDEIINGHIKSWENVELSGFKSCNGKSHISESKRSPTEISANFPHIPFLCDGPKACGNDLVWREHGLMEQTSVKSDVISCGGTVTSANTQWSAASKVREGMVASDSEMSLDTIQRDQGNHAQFHSWCSVLPNSRTDVRNPLPNKLLFRYMDVESDSASTDENVSVDLEFTDDTRPGVQALLCSSTDVPTESKCNFREHLLKTLDQHKSPIISSDSATTDRSSANDWADESSDATVSVMQSKRNSCPTPGYNREPCISKSYARFSPKRFRKKSHSRSRSMEQEVVLDLIRNRINLTGKGIDSDSTDTSSVEDVKTALNKDVGHRGGSRQQSPQADSSQHYNDTDNRIGNQSGDSCSGSSQSPDSNCYTGCGPATGILGLRYAIPYLSERLKMSLAKRIESGASRNNSPGKVKGQGHECEGRYDGTCSDPGCSTDLLTGLNDGDKCTQCGVVTVGEQHSKIESTQSVSDTNFRQKSDTKGIHFSQVCGLDDQNATNEHSSIFSNIPNILRKNGPCFVGRIPTYVQDRSRPAGTGKCSSSLSNDEGSRDEISQTDESEGLEISHSFQYIDISDGEIRSPPLVTESVPQLCPSDSMYKEICKSLQSHADHTKGSSKQRCVSPSPRYSRPTIDVPQLNYLPCVELSDSQNLLSYIPCKTELSESLNQISYLPCEELSESLKHLGQSEDPDNYSCAETGFLSADNLDVEDVDVEESHADLQFLSIEQDTSDCSSIHSDTDRSNLSEEIPVGSLFSTHSESDSGEADDEFECECDHCLQLRSRNTTVQGHVEGQDHTLHGTDEISTGHVDGEVQDQQRLEDGELEEGLYRISIAELSPLSNIMNSRRNELEVMFENVILQMLAVHPDLLSDATPPPADQTVIDSLPTLLVDQGHFAMSLSCPICLCVCEVNELLSCLPCQHLFHQLCIQAWLIKSGTCPVCRRSL